MKRKNFFLTENQIEFFRQKSSEGYNVSAVLRKIIDHYIEQQQQQDTTKEDNNNEK